MTKEHLQLLIERVATWPKAAQDKFAAALKNIEAADAGLYALSADERKAVEEGLAQAESGEFATDEQVAALLDHPWA